MENNLEGVGDKEAMHWLFGPDQEEEGQINTKEQEERKRKDDINTEGNIIPEDPGNNTELGEKSLNPIPHGVKFT